MFTEFTPIRGSLWKQRVNAGLGSLFLFSFALWAGLFIFQIEWGTNPIANVFGAVVAQETTLR